MIQNSFHIVLVAPGESMNVGSVARAMMNLGFSKLHLVAPRNFDLERARTTARWAEPILHSARHHATLKEALAEMDDVVGFSARTDTDESNALILPQWGSTLESTTHGNTALVFGPEDNGLSREDLDQCRWVVRIPATGINPCFNLAQAALLVMFEISRHTWVASDKSEERPSWGVYNELDRTIDSLGEMSGFYNKGTPSSVPGLLKNLFRRFYPDNREMSILLGLFRRIEITMRSKDQTENFTDSPPSA